MSYFRKTLILLFISLVTLSSCSKDDDGPATSNVLLNGRWKISLFVENGNNQSTEFSGYEFYFTDNGVVTGTRPGSATVNGSWTIRKDDDEKLLLNFGSADLFDELNDEWQIVERTSTKVRLEHRSGNPSGTDLLTLERL